MITLCRRCGHVLWSEVRSAAAFRFLVYFDDDQRSETYAEHVPRCPGCGVKLGNDAFEREYETTRRARDLD